jgi:hypothetical protein
MISNKENDKIKKQKYKIAMKIYNDIFDSPSNEIIKLKQENTILKNKIIELENKIKNI